MYFPKIDQRFDNDNRGGVANRTTGFQDLDGSVGGIRNAYILINDGENDSVATGKTCKIQPTWNAAVCSGDIGRLFLYKPGGTIRDLSAGSPVTLSRNGKDFKVTANQSNVRSGTEMRVNTDRQEVFLSVREMSPQIPIPKFHFAARGINSIFLDDVISNEVPLARGHRWWAEVERLLSS